MTKEEIRIALGIDDAGIRNGLRSVDQQLRGFKDRKLAEQREEQDYTSWWKSELAKRDEVEKQDEIQKATRRNMARRLYRQRALERERKEEENQPFDLGGFALEGTLKKTLKGLKHLVVLNLVSLGEELWQKMTDVVSVEFFNALYDINETTTRISNAAAQIAGRLRAARQGLQQSGADLTEAEFNRRFNKADDEEKKLMLSEKQTTNQKEQLKISKDIKDERAELASINKADLSQMTEHDRNAVIERRAGLIAKIAENQTKLNEKQVEAIELENKQDEVAKSMAEKEEGRLKRAAELNRKIQALRAAEAMQVFNEGMAQEQMLNQFRPSIGQLANTGYWVKRRYNNGYAWINGPFAGQAQDAESYRQEAMRRFMYGDVAGAKAAVSDYNRTYDQLSELGIIPERQEVIAKAQLEMAKYIQEIHDGKVDLKVSPSNG